LRNDISPLEAVAAISSTPKAQEISKLMLAAAQVASNPQNTSTAQIASATLNVQTIVNQERRTSGILSIAPRGLAAKRLHLQAKALAVSAKSAKDQRRERLNRMLAHDDLNELLPEIQDKDEFSGSTKQYQIQSLKSALNHRLAKKVRAVLSEHAQLNPIGWPTLDANLPKQFYRPITALWLYKRLMPIFRLCGLVHVETMNRDKRRDKSELNHRCSAILSELQLTLDILNEQWINLNPADRKKVYQLAQLPQGPQIWLAQCKTWPAALARISQIRSVLVGVT
jgi:hypothetical protein